METIGFIYSVNTVADLEALQPSNPVPGSIAYVIATDTSYVLMNVESGDIPVAGYNGIFWNLPPAPVLFDEGETAGEVTLGDANGKLMPIRDDAGAIVGWIPLHAGTINE